MAISAVVDGKFTPEFAAYTKLTIVNRVQNEERGIPTRSSQSMSFEQFMSAMERNQVLHANLARRTPSEEVDYNRIYEQQNGASLFARQRYEAIQKAYHLGLVDLNGVLNFN
ncbi:MULTISPECIES: hypothetical protein [Paenibacillus]|uniref:hypothetical protein n=1 Tax=Paenibacillus TaxID=44249 RepID=UPI000837CA89|nr:MULTISPECIES: hypothetical protein [Paenibacillus]GIP23596.1 hypothetical protein J22TS3_38710 [Paenibacillus sp. J22TS3]